MIRGSRSGFPLPRFFSSPSHPCEPDMKIKCHNKAQQHFQHYILTIAYCDTRARINKSIQVSIIIDNMLTGAGRGTTLFFSTSMVSAFRMSYLPIVCFILAKLYKRERFHQKDALTHLRRCLHCSTGEQFDRRCSQAFCRSWWQSYCSPWKYSNYFSPFKISLPNKEINKVAVLSIGNLFKPLHKPIGQTKSSVLRTNSHLKYDILCKIVINL